MRKALASRSVGLRTPASGIVSKGTSIVAPVAGWDAISPLAGMKPDRAIVLDNWFPQPGYIEVRRGYTRWSTGLGTGPVETLAAYSGQNPVNNRLFAVGNRAIYDVTAQGTAPASMVSGLSNNRWQKINFTTPGGNFLWMCNGLDSVQIFNGSAWSVPVITGLSSSSIVNVNAHKNRIWMIPITSMSAWYLPTNAVQGAAVEYPLGQLFTKGGYLVAMGTWTVNGGAGPDDYAVFITSKGQAAIFAGTDPASASTWAVKGVFDLGAPLGYRCFTKVGTDLALICIDGVVPLSQAIVLDRGAVNKVSITGNIQQAMNAAARSAGNNFGWQLLSYPRGTAAILNVPIAENGLQYQYVMNVLTGAWCRYTNQNANCWELFNDRIYFGGNNGAVFLADAGSLDYTSSIVARCQMAFNYYGQRGRVKDLKMLRPLFTTDGATAPALGFAIDFGEPPTLTTPKNVQASSAQYDMTTWDNGAVYPVDNRLIANWATVSGVGTALSLIIEATIGDPRPLIGWGTALWGSGVWDVPLQTTETVMQFNGYDAVVEMGGYV